MMRKHVRVIRNVSFALIELLVVISIIALLIALQLIREDVEDLVLSEQGHTEGYPYLAANYHGWYSYAFGTAATTSVSSGRHFRTPATATRSGWGFENTSFVDGHVISVSMQRLVELAMPYVVCLEYPVVAKAAWPQVSSPFPSPGPLPGSEFWFASNW